MSANLYQPGLILTSQYTMQHIPSAKNSFKLFVFELVLRTKIKDCTLNTVYSQYKCQKKQKERKKKRKKIEGECSAV